MNARQFHHRSATDPADRRSGMILVAAMLCLLAATAICGNIVRTIVRRHRDVHDAGNHLQAEWLCEAGLQRGLAALRTDAAYDGETWTIPVGQLPPSAEATVVITATRGNDPVLTARTVYTVGGLQRVVLEESVTVTDIDSDNP